MLTLGTGVGCGIIVDGKILHGGRGATGFAPEFGHSVIEVCMLSGFGGRFYNTLYYSYIFCHFCFTAWFACHFLI